MLPEKQYARNPEFIYRKIIDECVLVPIHQNVADMNCIYTLNEVGAFIWEQLEQPATQTALQTSLQAEYDADPEVLHDDLVRFLDEMTTIGALKEVE